MDLETLIIVVFCLVDDFLRDLCRECRLRQRGPAPVLADSEVLTVEIVGEFLGLDTDQGLHAYFRRYVGQKSGRTSGLEAGWPRESRGNAGPGDNPRGRCRSACPGFCPTYGRGTQGAPAQGWRLSRRGADR